MVGSRRVVAVGLVLAIGLAGVSVLAVRYHHLRQSPLQALLDDAQAATSAAAADLDADQQRLVAVAHDLATDLQSGALMSADFEPRLFGDARRNPDLFSLVVVLPAEPTSSLSAPAVISTEQGLRFVQLERLYEVRRSEWFSALAEHPEPGWLGPIHGRATGHFLAAYCEPWADLERPSLVGYVCVAWSLYELEVLRQALPSARFGYTWLLSQGGSSLAHPDIDWVRAARTPSEVADAGGDPRLREVGRRAIAREAGSQRAVDPFTGQGAVMFQEPLASSGWSLVTVVLEDKLLAGQPPLRQRQIELTVAVVLTLAAAAAAFVLGGTRGGTSPSAARPRGEDLSPGRGRTRRRRGCCPDGSRRSCPRDRHRRRCCRSRRGSPRS